SGDEQEAGLCLLERHDRQFGRSEVTTDLAAAVLPLTGMRLLDGDERGLRLLPGVQSPPELEAGRALGVFLELNLSFPEDVDAAAVCGGVLEEDQFVIERGEELEGVGVFAALRQRESTPERLE